MSTPVKNAYATPQIGAKCQQLATVRQETADALGLWFFENRTFAAPRRVPAQQACQHDQKSERRGEQRPGLLWFHSVRDHRGDRGHGKRHAEDRAAQRKQPRIAVQKDAVFIVCRHVRAERNVAHEKHGIADPEHEAPEHVIPELRRHAAARGAEHHGER